jgi:ribosomal protein S18 acetylase RimI-like enzyme
MPTATWRIAGANEDSAIVAMSLALYAHDPPPRGVSAAQVRSTLDAFRAEPVRGRAVVLDENGTIAGYAFLVSFWSNELGGEVCTIDELYVKPGSRRRGHSTALVRSLRHDRSLWPSRPVALELEVSPANQRARALYDRLGFRPRHNTTLRLLLQD